MPEDTNSVLICVATGTGIAPFRSFWRRCFYEDVPNYKFTGLFWLFMGVANSDAKLYDDEISDMAATYPSNFRVDYALSREQNNVRGGKMYIQDKVEEYADEVFDLLDNGAHIFFCGLKVRGVVVVCGVLFGGGRVRSVRDQRQTHADDALPVITHHHPSSRIITTLTHTHTRHHSYTKPAQLTN